MAQSPDRGVRREPITIKQPEVIVEKQEQTEIKLEQTGVKPKPSEVKPEQTGAPNQKSGKKKKGFKAVMSINLPPGMNQFVQAIKAPMLEVENMMLEDDRMMEEDIQAQQQFHSMKLM